MRFEFATATRILFGPGALKQIGSIATEFGRRAFVVVGTRPNQAGPLLDRLAESQIDSEVLSIESEPDVELVSLSLSVARETKCDLVIGFGGGSAIDTGKAIAALFTNSGNVLDYLEVIGRGRSLTQSALPYIAIPTTAGTGSEVTRNAVLASPQHRVKASLRSPLMLPRVALIDPELTYTLPPSVTASTGLDALTQLIEPYVSIKANPLIDAICREGMQRAARSLPRAYENGADPAAREDMSLASLFGGLALAN
ncbi:MAG TPA: iron-containing alcohol dehydrogenase, partial [Anaerolineae bacterium]